MNTSKDTFFKKHISPLLHHKVFALVLLYIAMLIIFTVWSKLVGANFLKLTTFRNILSSLVVSAFLTIGAGCLLIAGHIDLSQASIGAFASMLMGTAVQSWHFPWYLAIIAALLLSAVFGALNAVMVTKFRFPSFIATLAMASITKGLMYLFSSIGKADGVASNINFSDKVLSFLGKGKIGPIPFNIIVMIVFFIIFGITLSKTKFGVKVMLMGGNPVAATLAGINANSILFILFILSAVIGGIGGVFYASKLQQSALLALQTNQFTGITAAILGGISFGGGSGGMGGAFVGLLILNTFQIGMSVVGVNPFWVNVFTGILLLFALAIDFISQQRSRKAPTL